MSEHDRNILLLISESISKIELYTKPFKNAADFAQDSKSFDASLMNFIVITECVGRLSEYLKNTHSEVEWRKVYAFRNLIAHDYFGIDEEEVWDIVISHLPKLKEKIQNLTK